METRRAATETPSPATSATSATRRSPKTTNARAGGGGAEAAIVEASSPGREASGGPRAVPAARPGRGRGRCRARARRRRRGASGRGRRRTRRGDRTSAARPDAGEQRVATARLGAVRGRRRRYRAQRGHVADVRAALEAGHGSEHRAAPDPRAARSPRARPRGPPAPRREWWGVERWMRSTTTPSRRDGAHLLMKRHDDDTRVFSCATAAPLLSVGHVARTILRRAFPRTFGFAFRSVSRARSSPRGTARRGRFHPRAPPPSPRRCPFLCPFRGGRAPRGAASTPRLP